MATTPTTCTIQKASGLCGEPAVTTFIARDGQVYAECAAHSPSGRRIIAEVNYPPKVFTIKAPVLSPQRPCEGDQVTMTRSPSPIVQREELGVLRAVEALNAAGRTTNTSQVYSRAYPWVSRTRAANLLEYLSHGTTRYVTDVSKGGAHHWRLTDLGRATLERNKDVK
jgi:hypothetical protein